MLALQEVAMITKLLIPQHCSVQLLRLTLMIIVACVIYRQGTSLRNDNNAVSVFKSTFTRRSTRRLMSVDLGIPTVLANTTEVAVLSDNDLHLPRLSWHAAARSSVRVKESSRTCEEYMRLPPSEYSVLTAEQITRLSATEFRCTLPMMNFFGTKIQPILYVDVIVYPEFNRSEIVVLRAETVGSEVAERANGTFSINAITVVSAGVDKKGRKNLTGDTSLTVNVEVPPSKFPLRVIQTGGNIIMQASLDIVVRTFVRVLSADFQRWSLGNDSRVAIEDAIFSSI